MLYFALSKFFVDKLTGQPNTKFASIISLSIALLITYGVNSYNFNFTSFFFDLGVSEDILFFALPLILILGLLFLIWKFRSKSLLIIGGFFILLSFFVYEKTVSSRIGIILVLIWVFLFFKKKFQGTSKNEYKQHLKELRENERIKQAPIKARAQNIANIRKERLKRDVERARRQQKAEQKRAQQMIKQGRLITDSRGK